MLDFDTASLTKLIIDTANEELIPRYQQTERNFKADGTLVTAADLAIQQRIGEALIQRYPDIPFLGEEMPAETQRKIMRDSNSGFWCLDPLDGTANFVAGMPCFAISLAYIQGGGTRLGIIYDPLRDECFHAQTGRGAWLNHQPLKLNRPLTELADCVAMVDFKRLPDQLASNLATQPPYRSQRSIGSVALDWCWLAAGRVQLYLHGGAKLWDYAAGSLIHREAGGRLRLTHGHVNLHEELSLTLHPCMAVAAADQTLFRAWSDWLRQYD
jgi:myo-inositol-1(or 4)-monophosphatase